MHEIRGIAALSTLTIGIWFNSVVSAQDGGFADDLLENPSMNSERYFALGDVENIQRTASHENGVLTLAAQATEENDFRNRLLVRENTDYFESTFTLSSTTELGSDGRARGQIEMSLYNDLGVDGEVGDVSTFMSAEISANGTSIIEYCLVRRIDTDGNEEGLLEGGRSCGLLPMRIEFDMPIRAAMSFNRDTGTVTFQANQIGAVVSVEGPFFAHSEPFSGVAASPRDLAIVVLEIDEIRNSPTALSATEVNSGATEPEPFPPIQTEAAIEESSIAFPFTISEPLDFVDDFSQPTALLSFDPDRQDNELSGEYGIGFFDNALMIEAAEPAEDDCCANGRLRVQERTDFLAARVSLSSDTRIPADDDARSLIRIEGTWYNDTQNGGFDDRGGDVYVQSRIRVRGDGLREAGFCFRRQTGDGNDEDLNIVNGQDCGTFNTVPDFDTEYELSIALDRDAATMTFVFNDETQVVDLGGPVLEPQISDRAVTVQHEGDSGRAVGSLFSLTTDSGTINFTNGEAIIAPYRPHFSTQTAGREVSIIDGRLRLAMDSAVGEDNEPRFVSRNPSEHVSAEVEISSDSRLDGGLLFIGVGGDMYNDIMDGGLGPNDSEGAVYGNINMVMNDAGENYIEYCAFRSDSSDFSVATELLGADGETCPRFTSIPALDTPVTLVLSIDRDRGVITFSAGDETIQYTITTEHFTPHSFFNGIRVRARGGSQLISFADDLAFSANPVALANSLTQVGFTGNIADLGVNDSDSDVSSSTGGGGCSIASGSSGLTAPLLMLIGLLIAKLRKLASLQVSRRRDSRLIR